MRRIFPRRVFSRRSIRGLQYRHPDQRLSALRSLEDPPSAYTEDLPLIIEQLQEKIDNGQIGPEHPEVVAAMVSAVMAKGEAQRALAYEEARQALCHRHLSRIARDHLNQAILEEVAPWKDSPSRQEP